MVCNVHFIISAISSNIHTGSTVINMNDTDSKLIINCTFSAAKELYAHDFSNPDTVSTKE